MKNICVMVSVLVATATAWAQYEGAPDVRFTDEKPKVVQHNPSTAPTDENWIFNTEKARKLQKEAAESLGIPAELTLSLGDKTTLKLVLVPAGTFNMGSPRSEKYRGDDELRHRVTISKPFYMGVYEVTQEQWEQIMGKNHSQFHGGLRPVENVSYDEAVTFCYKVSQRTGRKVILPTEAQWEWACRAGTASPFWYGDLNTDFSLCANLADAMLANFAGNPYAQDWKSAAIHNPNKYDNWIPQDSRFNDGGFITEPVRKYKPNPWGLHNMHGNVWEWTRSIHKPYPYKEDDGRNKVKGISADTERVVRGGSWYDRPFRCNSSFRLSYPPYQRIHNVGFRIVVEE